MSKLHFPLGYDRVQLERYGPWPGPVPYQEGDKHYSGRMQKLQSLSGKIGTYKLLLLTGNSGTGKTSFLRAALIPKLRVQRTQAIRSGNNKAKPAVLVVRDWLTVQQYKQRNHDEILIDTISNSIKGMLSDEFLYVYDNSIQDVIQKDFNKLSRVNKKGTAYNYITRLAEASGNLMLCLDQFEEVLQGRNEQRDGILNTIAQLYHQRSFEITILISFRREFSDWFRHLDRQVGNLAQLTEFLEEMPEADVRNAIEESSKSAGVIWKEGVLDKLLEWVWTRKRGGQISTELVITLPDEVSSDRVKGSESIDLLRLQALLQELYQLALSETKADEPVTITHTNLATLKFLLEQEQFDDPLMSFIERRVFPLPIVEHTPPTGQPMKLGAMTGIPRDLCESDEVKLWRLLQQRRIAARMAPFFSSLGLKVQQYEAHLVANALREEWDTIGKSAEDIEDFVSSVGLKAAPTELYKLKLPDSEIDPDDAVLSGRVSARKAWTYSYTVKQILDACSSTFDRLEKCNILRPKTAQLGIVWELVHDAFGPALSAWSRNVRSDPLDALGAVIAGRGDAFRWKQLGGSVEKVCWRGCWLGPAADCSELMFDNVDWTGCDLRGTFFNQCRFVGGSFEDCQLSGAIFKNCSFTAGSDTGKRFTFKDIRANGLSFFGGSLAQVDFIGCSLNKMLWGSIETERLQVKDVAFRHCQNIFQWSIGEEVGEEDITLSGPLQLHDCELVLCDLRNLPLKGTEGESGVDIQGCEFHHCLPEALAALVDRSKGNERCPK